MGTSWFVEIREEEVIKFVEEQENPNTKRKTVYDVELFNNFIQTSNAGLLSSPTSFYELSPQLLNDHLWSWKKDGSDHEPTSFRGFLSSIHRYLNKSRTTASQFLLGRCA